MRELGYDICIIGGGASGLVAAIKSKEACPEASVVILEKMESVGRKLAASGNGRCNLSNVRSGDYERTLSFFSSIGLFTRVDGEGRVYPYSEDGRDVVSVLEKACLDLGVDILCRRIVENVSLLDDDYRFLISTEFNKPKAYRPKEEDGPLSIKSKKVLLATGGKSKPKLGTSGDGYKMAKELGHGISTLIPVLTGVETVEDMKALSLSGIREKVEITLLKSGVELFRERGELQFTDYGISGICVFDMSRFLEGTDYSEYVISVDFIPDFSTDDAVRVVEDTKGRLSSVVKEPVAEVILENKLLSTSPQEQLKDFVLHPKKLEGWDMAQVTRGGVYLDEIDENTGESKLVKGLYFSGEILDVDFCCGGFNLQNAWTTGMRAGEAMGKDI